MTRIMYRDYPSNWPNRARQITRVHILNETPPKGRQPGTEALCGTSAGQHTNSLPIIKDTPCTLPAGLTWCPKCVGLYAEVRGLTSLMAHALGLDQLHDDHNRRMEEHDRASLAPMHGRTEMHTHDLTTTDYAFTPVDDGQQGRISCWNGIKPQPGDYLILRNGTQTTRYKVDTMNPCPNVDPPTMWTATLTFAPRPPRGEQTP